MQNIKKIEKKINSFVNNICLMVETKRSISICISLMKNLDNKKIQNKDRLIVLRATKILDKAQIKSEAKRQKCDFYYFNDKIFEVK